MGEEKPMKKKLSVGLVFAIVLMMVAVTALAVTAIRAWTDKVADMHLDGAFITWGIDEKTQFIDTMNEAGLDMDEGLYEIMSNPDLDEETRIQAANQIIDDRYGDMMREYAKRWVEVPDTVIGMAPDPSIILRDTYLTEYPDASEQEVNDFIAYWFRDLGRRYEESVARGEVQMPVINEDYAYQALLRYVSEYLGISDNNAGKVEIRVEYNTEHNVWVCKAVVPKSIIPDGSISQELESYLTNLGDAWEVRSVIDSEGSNWTNRTLDEYLAIAANAPIWVYKESECIDIATQGIMATFGLSAEEADRYFVFPCDVYKDENRYALVTLIFKEHSNGITNDWKYAAIVNAGTGVLMDCVDPAGLWSKLPEYAELYPTLSEDARVGYERWLLYETYNPFGGYRNWTPEQKAEWNELLGLYVPIE
jgi:hypothetical protein